MNKRSGQKKLRLALSIISGRQTEFSVDEWLLLGFDPDSFSAGRGIPDLGMIKERAEEIIYYFIEHSSLW